MLNGWLCARYKFSHYFTYLLTYLLWPLVQLSGSMSRANKIVIVQLMCEQCCDWLSLQAVAAVTAHSRTHTHTRIQTDIKLLPLPLQQSDQYLDDHMAYWLFSRSADTDQYYRVAQAWYGTGLRHWRHYCCSVCMTKTAIKPHCLTLSVPHFSDCGKMRLPNRSGPYWSNPPFF